MGFSLARRNFSRHSASAYSIRRGAGKPSRTSWHRASAIHPFDSSTRQGTSYFLGPIRLKTSSSRLSSRTRVAVSPRRRRAWMSAVIRNTGAGSK